MIKVIIPTSLRQAVGNLPEIEVEAANIKELLKNIAQKYLALFSEICNDQGDLKEFVNIFVNDQDIKFLSKKETSLTPADIVHIIYPIAGG